MIRVNNRDTVEWKQEMTVRDVLDAMGYDYALITVTVNDTLVPQDEYDTWVVPDNADVGAFHLAHGG
ncbi:MAG: sulfur carrier protein ThiS [Chitinispirillaceae bacterium]|nr:sulfur carrier protein ThiS [Chitinispirillaceae bacterium]